MNEFYKPDRHTAPSQQNEAKTTYAEPENIRIVVDEDAPARETASSNQQGSPFGEMGSPFGQTNSPFGQTNSPFGEINTPFGKISFPQQGSVRFPAGMQQTPPVINDIVDTAKAYGGRIMEELDPSGVGFGKKLKNRSISLLLCGLFGIFGAHRFYEGKIATGILWALTGGLGLIGWIIDLIILINKPKYYEP